MDRTAHLTDPLTALARSDLLLGLAAALGRPAPGALSRLEALGRDAEPLLACAGLAAPGLREAIQALAAAAGTTPLEEWRAEAARLFEAGTACPANETAFVRRDKGAVLGDVCAFQRAFGLELSPESGEKADHVVAELELMALLSLMQGQALAQGREEDARVSERALSAFARDHLGEWLPAFCLALSEATPLPFYQATAEAVVRVWDALCVAARFDDPRGRPLPTVETDEGTPYECGLAEAGTA